MTTTEYKNSSPSWQYPGDREYKGIPDDLAANRVPKIDPATHKEVETPGSTIETRLRPILIGGLVTNDSVSSAQKSLTLNILKGRGWENGNLQITAPDSTTYFKIQDASSSSRLTMMVAQNSRYLQDGLNRESFVLSVQEIYKALNNFNNDGRFELNRVVFTDKPTEDLVFRAAKEGQEQNKRGYENNLININIKDVITGKAFEDLARILVARKMLFQGELVPRREELSELLGHDDHRQLTMRSFLEYRAEIFRKAKEGDVEAYKLVQSEEALRLERIQAFLHKDPYKPSNILAAEKHAISNGKRPNDDIDFERAARESLFRKGIQKPSDYKG